MGRINTKTVEISKWSSDARENKKITYIVFEISMSFLGFIEFRRAPDFFEQIPRADKRSCWKDW